MMRASILAFGGLLLAGALGGSPVAAQTDAQTGAQARTQDFVTAAAQSDQFEILEGYTTLAGSVDPRVRAFAQEMISAHTGTSRELARTLSADGLGPLPTGLGGDQAMTLGALQSLSGPDFDRTYLRQQVLAHEQALVVEQAYADDGPDAAVRQAAKSAVPIIRRHLQMAHRLQSELGGG